MANYTTSSDLLDDALSRAGEKIDGTSPLQDDAVRFLNRAYQGLWSGGSEIDPNTNEVWWWLRKDTQGVLNLNPAIIDIGTVSVTNNSTSILFTNAPVDSIAGRHFKARNHADVFIIATHTAGQAEATLDSVYTGTNNTTALYTVFQLDYDLASDLLYLSTPMRAYQSNRGEIGYMDMTNLHERWALENLNGGVPHNFTMIGQRKVRFSHYGNNESGKLIKVDYEYIREPADLADDTSEPSVPRQYRKILADWTLMYLLDKKEDSRVQDAAALTLRGIQAMAKENRRRMIISSKGFSKIYPRQLERPHVDKLLRTETGLIISGVL